MTGWTCKRCETANAAGNTTCEVCSSPVFYTREEFDRVLQQQLGEERKKLEKKMDELYRKKHDAKNGNLTILIIVLVVLIIMLSLPYII